ncbi:hypothetical protein COV15_00330 [Candidatus Woesearchaeota archaeon CG10_big_fil_rev_8_21_14_0_10_34_12]|nr:MAG: hypothetical protein COV15_00330 [Candidatus Woesearchaeota archaeon CG10_big_fil_rev_8_21_14_0_10_34_12]
MALIAIEGTDGSGKETQVSGLVARAMDERILAASMSFPRYDTPTGRIIRDYLDGKFGNPTALPPKVCAAFYAVDRLVAAREIRALFKNKFNVFLNRYAGSNFAHQAAKLPEEQRKEFIEWNENYEFVHLGIPKPDLTICLHVPKDETLKAIGKQGREKDGHESDEEYQQRVIDTYLMLAETKLDWRLVKCMDGERRKNIGEVTEEIWEKVRGILSYINP